MPHSSKMLAIFAVHAIVIGVVLVPAAAITAVLAFGIRASRVVVAARGTILVSVGTIVPALVAAYGLHVAWPWPWIQPDALYDGWVRKAHCSSSPVDQAGWRVLQSVGSFFG